jgi:hypothetical protein
MFESGQLTSYQINTLASLVILLVAASLAYFAWVVFGELWVAFYPDTPIAWLGIKQAEDLDLFESKVARDSRSAITFENQNPMALATEEEDAMDYGDSAIVVQADGDDEEQEAGPSVPPRVKKESKSGSLTRMLSLPQMLGGKQKVKRGYSDLEVEGEADPDDGN